MPDVGVLSLKIESNADQAASSLDKLSASLLKVKRAVSGAMDLSGYSAGLQKLAKVVDDHIHGSTIIKLSQLADSLQKLKNAGGSLSALGKLSQMTDGFSTTSQQVAKLKENLKEIKATGEIKIPIKTVVDDSLKTIYLNEKGNLMGNTPNIPALTEKYRSVPDRTLEDLYNGTRWTVNKDTGLREQITNPKDLMSQWLHGNGTETEQAYAIQQAAEMTKTSVDDVKRKLAELSGVAEQARARLQKLFNQHYYANSFGDVQQSIDNMLGIGSAPKSAKESMQAFLDGMSGMDSAAQTVRNMNPELAEMQDKAEKASWSLQDLKNAIGGLKKTSNHNIFGKLIKQFNRLVKFRMLRYVIRSITSGFKEGIENVYNYSKAINSALAPAMDSSVSVLAQMKNSLGAAVAPALQAIIPLLNQLVSGFINVINWANQLISLLNGQATWTRALPQTVSAFDKQKKAAKGAGAAIKDLLADWDELNIIQSETSGSGVGLTNNNAEEVLNMFEQVEGYDNRVRDIVNFIKDNFDDIKTVALGIGGAILAWKLSSAFIGDLGLLQHISIAAGAALIISGIKIGYEAGMQVGYTDGEDKESIIRAILGTAATALGGTLVGIGLAGATGGVVGAIAGLGIGLTFAVAGIINGVALRKSQDLEARAKAAILAEKKRWGGEKFTSESIKQYIENELSFEVTPKVSVLTPYVEGFGAALKTLDEEVQKFSLLANKRRIEIQLGVASTVSKDDLIAQANTTIDALNAAQNSGLSALAVAFEVTPPKDAEGNLLDVDEMLKTIKLGDQAAIDYMKDLGRKMGEALNAGAQEGVASNTEALAQKYADEMILVETRATELYQAYKLEQELTGPADFQNMDLDSALEMAQNQQAIWDEQKEQFKNDRLALADQLAQVMTYKQSILESARRTNENGENDATIAALEASIATYETAIERLKDVDTAWDEIAGDTYEKMRDAWIELLKSKGVLETDSGKYIGVIEDWKSTIEGVLSEGGTMTALAGTIRNWVEDALEKGWTIPLGASRTDKVKAWVDQTYDIGGLEGVEDKTAVIDYIKETFGEESIAGVLWLLGENQEAITKILADYYGGNNPTIATEIADLINEVHGLTTPEEWDQFYNKTAQKSVNDWETFDRVSPIIKDEFAEFIEANGGSYDNFLDFDFAGIAQSLVAAGNDLDTVLIALEDVIAFAHYNQLNEHPELWNTEPDTSNLYYPENTQNNMFTTFLNGWQEWYKQNGAGEEDISGDNQQIVKGISQANNGVISAIEELGNYIVRELQKSRNQPVQVNLNPSSSWGKFIARSAEHYSHVTG